MANYAKRLQNCTLCHLSSGLGPDLLYFTAKRKIFKHEELFIPYKNNTSKSYDTDFRNRNRIRKHYFRLKEIKDSHDPSDLQEIQLIKDIISREDPDYLDGLSDTDEYETFQPSSSSPKRKKQKLVDPKEHGLCLDSIIEEGEIKLDNIDLENLPIPGAQSYLNEISNTLEEGEIPLTHLKNLIQCVASGNIIEPNALASSLFPLDLL
jgi:hypothetical protein